MGMFDYVWCSHEMFGADRGSQRQFKDMASPWLGPYEITPEGRLIYEVVTCEDRSDPTAANVADRLAGCMTAVPTGEKCDMNYHGYLHLSCFGRCKFTDGNLVAFERDESA